MGYLIAAVVALFAFSRNGGSILGVTSTSVPVPGAVPVAPQSNAGQLQAEQGAATAVGNALNLVPVIGPALSQTFNAIKNALFQASAQRRKQAIDENSAVAQAVPGWDQAMTYVRDGYNKGSLSLQQALAIVDIAWANYWSEVGGFIQPGRNGCQSGSMSKQQADQQYPGMRQCSGDWGAACCVGYADLANGANSIKAALTSTDNTGKQAVASVPSVSASKYGGTNRAAYTLTFLRPSSVFSL